MRWFHIHKHVRAHLYIYIYVFCWHSCLDQGRRWQSKQNNHDCLFPTCYKNQQSSLRLFFRGLLLLTPPPQQSRTHWPHKSNGGTQHWSSSRCGRCAYCVKLSSSEWLDDVGWTLHKSGNAFNSPKKCGFSIYYTPRIERTFTGATSYFWNRKGLLRVVSCKVFWGSNSPFWLLTTTCLFVLNVFDLWRCSPINLPLPLSIYVIYIYDTTNTTIMCIYKYKG